MASYSRFAAVLLIRLKIQMALYVIEGTLSVIQWRSNAEFR